MNRTLSVGPQLAPRTLNKQTYIHTYIIGKTRWQNSDKPVDQVANSIQCSGCARIYCTTGADHLVAGTRLATPNARHTRQELLTYDVSWSPHNHKHEWWPVFPRRFRWPLSASAWLQCCWLWTRLRRHVRELLYVRRLCRYSQIIYVWLTVFKKRSQFAHSNLC